MTVKVKLRPEARAVSRGSSSFGRSLLELLAVAVLACLVMAGAIAAYFYHKYEGVVDARLAAGPLFAPVAQIYAAPREVRPGQQLSAEQIARELRQAGYNAKPELGTFHLDGDSITIKPGPQSYHSTDGAVITTDGSVVQSVAAENGASLRAYQLEPLLITALSEDKSRSKRRLITYQDLPPRLIAAVLAIEDRRFFEHGGINYLRTAKCAVDDLLSHHMSCGGSTLTQQLARGFFLSPEKRLTRKIAEITITYQLESRFTKQQILEMYANQINLGQRGSYAINGFGEAAQAYFGKDLGQLDLAQCALLAGMIQSPSRLNPYRHSERATERRNLVLDSMVETNAITPQEASRAKAEPLRLAPLNVDASDAPWFVDLVHEQLVQRIGEQAMSNSGNLRIYTSLDPELQRAASSAVEAGMMHVDELIRKLHTKTSGPITYPQVALIALDPHTGQVLALVGGRNYATSQLDHAVAERPTGSIFKPFVYAAAYNTSLNNTDLDGNGVFTAITRLNDDPTTFTYDGKSYNPGNFERGEYPGMVTATTAIVHSLNIATINLAQLVGFENVAALARSAGIVNARGTPSVAIGTYDATPIDMAGAYTVFANNGVHLKPWMLASVRNSSGDIVADYAPEAKQILDPRTAYLTQSMLENVMSFGTGASARQRGFRAPAAGKTGTSHDVWFAGYSSNLLCVVWVGNDDYTDISNGLSHKLQGSDAAAPIWAEFMNRAIKLPQYSDMKPFVAPDGVQVLRLDRDTNLLADATCPKDFNAAFLDGTQPQNTCSQMSESPQSLVQKLFGNDGHPQGQPDTTTTPDSDEPPAGEPPQPKKRNFFQKLFGGGARPKEPSTPPVQPAPQ